MKEGMDMRGKIIVTMGMILLAGILISGFMRRFLFSIYGMEFRIVRAVFFADAFAIIIQIMQIRHKKRNLF